MFHEHVFRYRLYGDIIIHPHVWLQIFSLPGSMPKKSDLISIVY